MTLTRVCCEESTVGNSVQLRADGAGRGAGRGQVRDLYWTFRNLRNRVADFLRYRRVTANMDERFPDATAAQLERADHTCIVCREDMTAGGRNKVLPCGHVFHLHCLRCGILCRGGAGGESRAGHHGFQYAAMPMVALVPWMRRSIRLFRLCTRTVFDKRCLGTSGICTLTLGGQSCAPLQWH